MHNYSSQSSIIGIMCIIFGCVLLFFVLDVIIKVALIVCALWLIMYGFALRGINTSYTVQRYIFRMFK